jgi:hypothetical protein
LNPMIMQYIDTAPPWRLWSSRGWFDRGRHWFRHWLFQTNP